MSNLKQTTRSKKMPDLSTEYLGLKLKSPIIAASSGLTNSIKDIQEFEQMGIGAVVLKSIFEEEISWEMHKAMAQTQRPATLYPEIFDYFDIKDTEDTISKYFKLIKEAKKVTSIPIIASINCVSSHEWPLFIDRIQDAGADALELNMFILPSDLTRTAQDFENVYFESIEAAKKVAKIPISLKISYYFSSLAQFIQRLSETGIQGLVLFNRFYSPDVDIHKMEVIPSNIYSNRSDITMPIRWIGITSPIVKCDLAASTGVHSGEDVIKLLLVGAKAVQVASLFYQQGIKVLPKMNAEIFKWMEEHNFETIDEFRGKLSYKQATNPAVFERTQFMKYFAGVI